jgi:DNA-binding NtrC family response regulator
MKILLVEDEEFLADNLIEYLSRLEKVQIMHANNAEDAFEMLNDDAFELIIADLNLPDSQDCMWLTNLPTHHTIQKVIIISSYSIPIEVQNDPRIYIQEYLEKPFDVQKLYSQVEEIMTQMVQQ